MPASLDTGDAVNIFIGRAAGQVAAVTRIAPSLYRFYFFHHIEAIPGRLSGSRDIEAAFGYLRDACVPGEWLLDAQPHGPLATFDGAHRWVERPYRDGVVLVGDAGGRRAVCANAEGHDGSGRRCAMPSASPPRR